MHTFTSVKVHTVIPYSLEKNLGKAYNETMSLIPDGDWACLIDHDVQFLTPDAIKHLHEYVRLYPYTGIFTCFTNRLHPLGKQQLWREEVEEDDSMRHHTHMAQYAKARLYRTTELIKHISGFLMMISKEMWKEIKFSEDKLCLGVDNDFSDRVLKSGRDIKRMDGIYVWHSYRLLNGIKDKTHLL